MQIDPIKMQCWKVATSKKKSRWVQRAFALLALMLLATVSSALAQSAAVVSDLAPNIYVISPSAVGKLAAPAPINAPEPQSAVEDLAGESISASTAVPLDEPGGYQVAPIHRKYILPDMRAQPLRARDKIMIGLQDTYSPMNFGGMLVAAGYEQLRNGQPNYGTDRGAFGERLGAAAIRDTAQGVLTDAVYAPLLHEDPRYYVEGPQHGVVHRALYALTRPLITRTDSGRTAINGALLLGYASSSILDNAYYPQVNRNIRDTSEAFGGSVGGSALGFLLTEFTASLWSDLHSGHKQ
jgi:hypothetical protein